MVNICMPTLSNFAILRAGILFLLHDIIDDRQIKETQKVNGDMEGVFSLDMVFQWTCDQQRAIIDCRQFKEIQKVNGDMDDVFKRDVVLQSIWRQP